MGLDLREREQRCWRLHAPVCTRRGGLDRIFGEYVRHALKTVLPPFSAIDELASPSPVLRRCARSTHGMVIVPASAPPPRFGAWPFSTPVGSRSVMCC